MGGCKQVDSVRGKVWIEIKLNEGGIGGSITSHFARTYIVKGKGVFLQRNLNWGVVHKMNNIGI